MPLSDKPLKRRLRRIDAAVPHEDTRQRCRFLRGGFSSQHALGKGDDVIRKSRAKVFHFFTPSRSYLRDKSSVNEKFLIVNRQNRKFPIFVYMHKFVAKYMVKILA